MSYDCCPKFENHKIESTASENHKNKYNASRKSNFLGFLYVYVYFFYFSRLRISLFLFLFFLFFTSWDFFSENKYMLEKRGSIRTLFR